MDQINPAQLEQQQARDLIQAAMLARGWSQSDLARQAHLPRYTINRVMRGATAISPEVRRKLALALNLYEELGVDISNPVHTIRPQVEFAYHRNADGSAFVRLEGVLKRNVALVIDAIINDDRDIPSDRLLQILSIIAME